MTTVIVSGSHYGGTSATAGVVHLLGFPVDFGASRANEDQELHGVKNDKNLFKQLIDRRTEQYGDWGFKIPWVNHFDVDWLRETCEDPKFVVVLRDPAAIETSKNLPGPSAIVKSCKGVLENQKKLLECFEHSEVYVLSYERLCRDPVREANRLAEWLGVSVSSQQADMLHEYITGRRYRSVTEFERDYENI